MAEMGEILADHENRLSELEAYHFYPDGLTPEERLDILEKKVDNIISAKPWLAQDWEAFNQLKGLVLKLQRDLNDHIKASKKSKTKRSYYKPSPEEKKE